MKKIVLAILYFVLIELDYLINKVTDKLDLLITKEK